MGWRHSVVHRQSNSSLNACRVVDAGAGKLLRRTYLEALQGGVTSTETRMRPNN